MAVAVLVAVLLALAVGLTGCASVIVRPDDGIGTKVVKVSTRVVLGLATIGVSEIRIDNTKQDEALQAEWRTFYDSLDTAKTKTPLVGILGLKYVCRPLDDGLEACEWNEWRQGYSVTCLLPTDGSAREPESCKVRRN